MKNYPTVWFRQVAYGISAAVLAADSYQRFGLGKPVKRIPTWPNP